VPLIGEPLALGVQHGLYAGNHVRSFVAEHLADHGVHTFADLRDDDPESALPPGQRYKVVVHASDVSRSRLLRLPWDYDPLFGLDPDTQSVADAVRASASIPFFFTPVKLRPASGGEPSWIVDGGLMSNYPINVFDRTDGRPPRWETVGIRLSAELTANAVTREVHGLLTLTEGILSALVNWSDLAHVDESSVIARTIFVDTTGYKSTNFHITRDEQDQLYENGRAAATKWLAAPRREPGAAGTVLHPSTAAPRLAIEDPHA
jgi:NTE family protein